jgi:hypothetical protein
VSLVGVLLGPIYPIAMNHAGVFPMAIRVLLFTTDISTADDPYIIVGRVLPRWLLTGSIGWIAGFGQAGSAVLPFMTGALASRVGIKSLQPLCVVT